MTWSSGKPVVVPIDFSDESFSALGTAAQLVGDLARLHAIHVLPALNAAEPGVVWGEVDDAQRCEHARQALQQRLDEPLASIDVAVVTGDPGHEIADFADRLDAELIVVPSHGRTGARRLLMGSVAERVVRLAHCAVLVLKPSRKSRSEPEQ